MCWSWQHRYGWPRRIGDTDYQVCTDCGHQRVSLVQFGHFRPGVSSRPILTANLEAEVLHEQAEIRRREAFWK